MTEGTTPGERTCTNCSRAIPGTRSVCPACGTLQPSQSRSAPQSGPRATPRPGSAGASAPASTRGGTPSGAEPPTAPRTAPAAGAPIRPVTVSPRYAGSSPGPAGAPAARPAAATSPRPTTPTAPPPKRRTGVIVGVVIVVIACLGAAAFGAMELRDDDTSSTTATKAAASANADPRTAAVLAFCGNRKPIRDPEGVAPFVPGKGAVAYAQLPQPASSTEEAGSRVLQVSPVIGNPNLSLEKSIALVNVAVCVDQSASTPAQGTCDYDLTNPSSVGQKATSRLLKTTYRAKVYEMRTGKLLTSGTLSTPVDRCPGYAYIGGKGVSNPLTEAALVAWLGQHLVGGVPQ